MSTTWIFLFRQGKDKSERALCSPFSSLPFVAPFVLTRSKKKELIGTRTGFLISSIRARRYSISAASCRKANVVIRPAMSVVYYDIPDPRCVPPLDLLGSICTSASPC
jgi:hypothetical protein